MCVQRPDGASILEVDPVHRLDALGINQLFFESREPPLDEYSLADLRADFPEGRYRVSGVDFEGERRVGTARFTHAIPAAPEILVPPLTPEEQAGENVVPREGLIVRWNPVTRTVDGGPFELAGYEVIVTKVEYENPDAVARPKYDVHVPPGVTELAVPLGFLEPETLYEIEVLAIEATGNQTISVGFFTTD